MKSADPDNVRYCSVCHTKTWHIGDVCEWADSHPKIRGEPEMLERLRAWAEPLLGHSIPDDGPGNIQRLQDIIEDAAAASGMTPQYRKPTA